MGRRPLLRWRDAPVDRPGEDALVAFWRTPTAAHATRYARALVPIIRRARAMERRVGDGLGSVQPSEPLAPERFGPYLAERALGRGGDGWALHARHGRTGQAVTIKAPARGDGWVLLRLGPAGEWHPHLVRIFDGEQEEPPSLRYRWVAREYAGDTLAGAMHRRGGPLPAEQAVGIFAAACEAVAWLHARHIYRWSAHAKNVYRAGGVWKIGDMGRSVCFVPPDHPLLEPLRDYWRGAPGAEGAAMEAAELDALATEHWWGHPTGSGFWPFDPERERRLRMDDCAMLGGLLCQLLTERRWEWCSSALATRPYCSAHYPLTGDARLDTHLSAILNRAWRGDAGGALLLASSGQGEQAVYQDPLELLADVRAMLNERA